MNKRKKILVGMALGALWAIVVVALPSLVPSNFFVPLNVALIVALLPGGVFLLLVIGRLAQRRFFDDATIDGETFLVGSDAEIDQRVLTNTVEQLVLALVIWPFVGLVLGGAAVITLGIAFGIARVAFWIGYHHSPPLRAFGFAASFYPTIAAAVWSAMVWFV
ncbi:MAG: MAPEG family protein [Boseongicola sp.]